MSRLPTPKHTLTSHTCLSLCRDAEILWKTPGTAGNSPIYFKGDPTPWVSAEDILARDTYDTSRAHASRALRDLVMKYTLDYIYSSKLTDREQLETWAETELLSTLEATDDPREAHLHNPDDTMMLHNEAMQRKAAAEEPDKVPESNFTQAPDQLLAQTKAFLEREEVAAPAPARPYLTVRIN